MSAEINALLEQNKFLAFHYVEDYLSVAHFFPNKTKRCGIYVLHFANGEYYVGQTVNIVQRYHQHCKNHADIQYLSFKPVAKSKLNDEEKQMVRVLENAGCFLRNISLVSYSASETDFDLIMSKADQERWLEDTYYIDHDGQRLSNSNLRRRYRSRYKKLMSQPHIKEVLPVLRRYVQQTIPAYIRSESAFWNVTALRSKTLYTRINVGGQVTFDVFDDEYGLEFGWFLQRQRVESVFGIEFPRGQSWSLNSETSEPIIYIGDSGLVKGGHDQVYLYVNKIEYALELLDEPEIIRIMRLFNLGLAQKGPCLWGHNHCLDLADHLVEIDS